MNSNIGVSHRDEMRYEMGSRTIVTWPDSTAMSFALRFGIVTCAVVRCTAVDSMQRRGVYCNEAMNSRAPRPGPSPPAPLPEGEGRIAAPPRGVRLEVIGHAV